MLKKPWKNGLIMLFFAKSQSWIGFNAETTPGWVLQWYYNLSPKMLKKPWKNGLTMLFFAKSQSQIGFNAETRPGWVLQWYNLSPKMLKKPWKNALPISPCPAKALGFILYMRCFFEILVGIEDIFDFFKLRMLDLLIVTDHWIIQIRIILVSQFRVQLSFSVHQVRFDNDTNKQTPKPSNFGKSGLETLIIKW